MRVLRHVWPTVTVRVGNVRMRIDLQDRIIAKRLYLGTGWEPELQRLLTTMDLRGAVCLDIGANIGVHTLLLSQLVGPSGYVYAFEPEPRSFELLKHNLRLNGATNVTPIAVALGDTRGSGRLIVNPRNRGDHRLAPAGSGRGREVAVHIADDFLATEPQAPIGFIKIDVQGYEHHVLRGLRTTLTRCPDAIVAIEVFPEALALVGSSARTLMESLSELGMRGWEFAPRPLPLQEPWLYDLVPKGQQVDVIVSRNGDLLEAVLRRCYGTIPSKRYS